MVTEDYIAVGGPMSVAMATQVRTANLCMRQRFTRPP
jgi:hypothetical protein